MSTTKLADLIKKKQDTHIPEPPQQVLSQKTHEDNFEELREQKNLDTRPIANQIPVGNIQGLSGTEESGKKEYFQLCDLDYKSAILVFSLVLILTTGIVSSCMKSYVPATVGPDNRNLMLGSFFIAIIAAILFLVIKFFGKF